MVLFFGLVFSFAPLEIFLPTPLFVTFLLDFPLRTVKDNFAVSLLRQLGE